MAWRDVWRWPGMLLLAIAVLSLAACSADCGWSGRGEAWIDQNEDGIWTDDEVALEGVSFMIRDGNRGPIGPWPMESAKDGSAVLSAFLPGCPRVKLEVYVDTPAGYLLTTEPRVPVRDEGDVARFGFVPVKD